MSGSDDQPGSLGKPSVGPGTAATPEQRRRHSLAHMVAWAYGSSATWHNPARHPSEPSRSSSSTWRRPMSLALRMLRT